MTEAEQQQFDATHHAIMSYFTELLAAFPLLISTTRSALERYKAAENPERAIIQILQTVHIAFTSWQADTLGVMATYQAQIALQDHQPPVYRHGQAVERRE